MSVSSSACKFFTPPLGFGGQMGHLGPQFPTENDAFETASSTKHPLCKKPSTYENAILTPKMPVATNNAMTGNFKTQLCSKFEWGHCSYGTKCLFAHGIVDMRQSLPNLQGIAGNDDRLAKNWNGDFRMVDQSKLCRMFYFGKQCKYGDKCRFLHVSTDENIIKKNLRRYRENSVISIGTAGLSGGYRSGFANSNPGFKKRKLCNNWEMGGCPYGKICRFAHGQAELEKPAGHIALVSGIMPTKLPNILPAGKVGIGTSHKLQVQGMQCLVKWKAAEKICGIYADWIEDMPLLHSSLKKWEN